MNIKTKLLELKQMIKDYNEKNTIKNRDSQMLDVMQQLPSSNVDRSKLD